MTSPHTSAYTKKQQKYDKGLISRLKVDLADYERGVSGASRCENVQVSKKHYIRMAELAIMGLAELEFRNEVL